MILDSMEIVAPPEDEQHRISPFSSLNGWEWACYVSFGQSVDIRIEELQKLREQGRILAILTFFEAEHFLGRAWFLLLRRHGRETNDEDIVWERVGCIRIDYCRDIRPRWYARINLEEMRSYLPLRQYHTDVRIL
jgi:hypothetical protein